LELARSTLDRQDNGRKALLKRVANYAHEQDVPVRTLLRATRGVSSGILGVAEAWGGVGLILMGWHGQLSTQRVAGEAWSRTWCIALRVTWLCCVTEA